jgi:RNA polymerase sigma-70 factor, ECF subfamily
MRGKLIPLRRLEGSPAEMSDEALVAACAVGENAALGALFDRYQGAVYRFLARLSGTDERDLDDLVQATFLEVYRASGQFAGRAQVKTWILGIAANVARHHVRSEVRRKAMVSAYAERPQHAAARPDQTAEQRELMARLRAALEELPHDLRVAFVMCDLEEIKGVDAARVLDIREGTLWRRLHEARKALRAALEERPR